MGGRFLVTVWRSSRPYSHLSVLACVCLCVFSQEGVTHHVVKKKVDTKTGKERGAGNKIVTFGTLQVQPPWNRQADLCNDQAFPWPLFSCVLWHLPRLADPHKPPTTAPLTPKPQNPRSNLLKFNLSIFLK